jgi:hypothetical protein
MRPRPARAKPNSLPTLLESHRRPLTDQERRTLRAKIRSLQGRGVRSRTGWIPIAVVIIFVLWLVTILAADAPWMVVTAFWLVTGGVIALWVSRDMRRHASQFDDMAVGLQSALIGTPRTCTTCARVHSSNSRKKGARFPSLDFSLVHVVDEAGRTLDMLIDKRGARAKSARTIPASEQVERPEHLEVRVGTIDSFTT